MILSFERHLTRLGAASQYCSVNNVNITAGSGTSVATDDCAGVQYQRMKLVDGTEDSTAAIPGDATNGLYVNVTKHVPGTGATNLGKAVDSAAGGTDTGVVLLQLRDDALTTLTPVDGDYVPDRCDSTGSKWVTLSSAVQLTSIVPDSAGTLTHTGGQITSATTTTLVAAVAAKQTKIYGLILMNGGTANNITIQDSTPTNLVGTSAVWNLAANQGIVLDLRGDKWFNACATNTGLQIITSSVGPLTWDLYYTNN